MNSLPPPPRTWLGRVLAAVAGAVLIAAGFMFSLVILVVGAVLAVLGGAYFWWKTREARRAMADIMQQARAQNRRAERSTGHDDSQPATSGRIIEGELIREDAANQEEDKHSGRV